MRGRAATPLRIRAAGWALTAALAAIVLIPVPGHAQTLLASRLQQTTVLPISSEMQFQGLSLEDALERLGAAGVPLIYSSGLVRGVGPVACDCAGITPAAALRHMLRGTGVDYRRLDTGEFLLIQRPAAVPAVVRAGTIGGRVTAVESGEPIEGVSIRIVDTTIQTITNENGAYVITSVPAGSYQLRATILGYRSVEQTVEVSDGETTTANFALEINPVTLSPLDVTISTGALVATEQKRIGNAIVVISEDEILQSGAGNLRELLAGGRAPGVESFLNGGENGAGGQIQIRGASSFLQDQAPLIYVDGVPVDVGSGALNRRGGIAPERDGHLATHARLDELTLNQIERIEIVKGPAATTMYGTDAINGVIQIFTKRGAPGQTRITAEIQQGFSTLESVDNPSVGSERAEVFQQLFHEPRIQRYSASVSGGADEFTYSFGASHARDDGIVVGNEERNTTVRGSFGLRPRDDLNIRVTGSYVQRGYNTRQYRHLFYFADQRESENATDFDFETIEQALDLGNRTATDVSRLYSGVTLSYQPFEVWSTQVTVGIDNSSEVNERIGVTSPDEGITRQRVTRDFHRTSGRVVTSLAYPREGLITSTFSVGMEAFHDQTDRFNIRGTNLPSREATDFDLAEEISGSGLLPADLSSRVLTGGGFVQEMIGFNDQLFITAGLRADGSSTFGDDYGLQVYPKLSGSYVFDPTAFLRTKVRAAWGRSGKAPDPFAKDLTYILQRNLQGEPILRLGQPGNAHLKPEVGSEIEVGVENYFFGNLASFVATYFHQTTTDAILTGPVPASSGFTTGPLTNVGELRSQGFELAADVMALRREDAGITVGLTLTHLIENGVVVDLGDAFDYLSYENQGTSQQILQGVEVGESIRSLAFGSPFHREEDVYGNYVNVGSRVPTTYGAAFLEGRVFDGLRLYTNLTYGLGGHAFDYVRASRDQQAGMTQLCCWYVPDVATSRYVFRTDYVKLKTARVSYTVPEAWIRGFGEGTEVWIEGRNLVSWDVFPRGDPEVNDLLSHRGGATGAVGYVIPSPRTFEMGLRVHF